MHENHATVTGSAVDEPAVHPAPGFAGEFYRLNLEIIGRSSGRTGYWCKEK